jgi:hypothetical protein
VDIRFNNIKITGHFLQGERRAREREAWREVHFHEAEIALYLWIEVSMSISRFLLVVGALAVFALPAMAQFGQVDGYVLGPDKKPIMGAVVEFDRLDSKVNFEVKTDKKGYYAYLALPTGDYSITVTVDGQFRDRRDYYHISPGRQDATQGNSVLGLTFNLKPLGVCRDEKAEAGVQRCGRPVRRKRRCKFLAGEAA